MIPPSLPVIELGPSLRMAWLLAAAHLGAVLLLVTLPIDWRLAAIAALGLAGSAAWSVTRHALRRGAGAVTALVFSDREQLHLRRGNGEWHAGRLEGSSTTGAGFAILNIRLESSGMAHVVIAGDGIDENDFRRLRVWLRWGPRPAAAEPEQP